jgi:hypothetical protein
MKASDVRNSRLISNSCNSTPGRQQQFSLLSAEAAAINAHYSQPNVEVAIEGGIFENLL